MRKNTRLVSGGVDEGPMNRLYYSEGLRTPPIPVSAVLAYLYCPRLAYLKYRLRLRMDMPTKSQVRGVLVHKVLEGLFMHEHALASNFRAGEGASKLYSRYVKIGLKLTWSLMKGHDAEAVFKLGLTSEDAVNMVKPVVFKRAYMYVSELLKLHLETGLEGRQLAETFIPRRESEVMVRSLGLGLSGVVDLVEEHRPLEIKTGVVERESHVIQVTLYALLLEDAYGITVREGYIYYADIPRLVKIPVTKRLRVKALELKEKASRLITSGDPPSKVTCHPKCFFRYYCISLKNYGGDLISGA